MNERELLKLQKQLAFYEQLTDLLNGVVKEKGEDIQNNEQYCDALKWKITRMIEEVYKLDILNDDFDLGSFVAQNIDATIERMKVQMDKPWLRDKLTLGLTRTPVTGTIGGSILSNAESAPAKHIKSAESAIFFVVIFHSVSGDFQAISKLFLLNFQRSFQLNLF